MRALTRPAIALALSSALIAAGSVGPAGAARAAKPKSLRTASMKTAHGPRVVAGEVLVRFRAGRDPSNPASVGALGLRSAPIKGWKLVHLKAGETVEHALARFGSDPAVAEVTANHVYHSLGVPDDTLFGLQWGLRNTGQTIQGVIGTSGADISAPSAWDTTTGSSSVIIAVADSGVASAHPDLKPNTIAGRNFVPDRSSSNTVDAFGHGTHVAGIIGAVGNDGYGVTGVAQHVKIMPVRVLDDTGSGDTVQIAQGFNYAAANGAKVVNASFGGSDPDPALNQAIADHPNTLFVVAAGNSGSSNDLTASYPCNYPLANVICVAASDQHDQLAGFSNYGARTVHLAAPGENIASTAIPDAAGYGGSGYSLADSPNGGYANDADTWAQSSTVIDPAGRTNCNLSYRLRLDLAPDDQFTAETAPAGAPSTWTAVDTISDPAGATTGGNFILRTKPVGADGSAFHLRFHLVSNATQTDEGVFVDNVAVVCGASTIYADTFGSALTGWTTGGTANWGTTSVAGNWVYMSGTSMAAPFVSGAASLIWAAHPTATVAHVKNVIIGSVDVKPAFSGKTISSGRLNVARALQYSTDITAPSNVHFTGSGIAEAIQLGPSFGLNWSATDGGTGVKSYDVRYERAAYNGGFGRWTTWRSGATTTGATFASRPGYSYCLEVRARDKALNVSAWSSPRCTTFPVDDPSLYASAGWSRLKSSNRYLGTDSYTTRLNATLSLPKAFFRRMDLVATVCSGCGSVAVYFGSVYYGTFSFNAPSFGTRHLVLVRSSSHMNGPNTVTIKVVTSGKPVMIEGLSLSRY